MLLRGDWLWIDFLKKSCKDCRNLLQLKKGEILIVEKENMPAPTYMVDREKESNDESDDYWWIVWFTLQKTEPKGSVFFVLIFLLKTHIINETFIDLKKKGGNFM